MSALAFNTNSRFGKRPIDLLHIESDPDEAAVVALALERSWRSPINLRVAKTLEEAIRQLRSCSFDVALLEVNLPDSNGFATYQCLHDEAPKLPIVIVTSFEDPILVTRMVQEGVREFLPKKYIKADQLRDALSFAIDRQSLATEVELRGHRLEQNELLVRNLIEESADGLLVIAEGDEEFDGKILFANPAAQRMFQLDAEQLSGPGIGTPEIRGRADDIEIVRPDGSVGLAEMRVSRGVWMGRNANLASFRDMTERKNLENQLHQAMKMEAIGNLTGGVAHDFNNLLGVIIGNLDLLSVPSQVAADADALIGEALDAALRGADLVQRLLAFARRQPLQPRRVEVNEIVERISEITRRTQGGQIRIALELAENLAPIVADPSLLETSLLNMINNACDAMPGGGALSITTGNRYLDMNFAASHAGLKPGHYTTIELSDTGSGMPPEVLNQIFEPFFTTKGHGRGSGLGLSMVFGFVKQSDGQIYVYSEVGIGTTFRLYLPSVSTPAEPTLQTQAKLAPDCGGLETILAVEDNRSLRLVVARQLKELGYRFLEAEDGPSALKILESESVDLLFTDIVMPNGMSGYDLAHAAVSRWPTIKVVLTSGFTDAKPKVSGEPPANIRLLPKPYRKSDLARILRETLDS